jgi:hypothetical protein
MFINGGQEGRLPRRPCPTKRVVLWAGCDVLVACYLIVVLTDAWAPIMLLSANMTILLLTSAKGWLREFWAKG